MKKTGSLKRLIKLLFKFYPVMLPITILFIIINAVVSAVPALFQQQIIEIVDTTYKSGDWAGVSTQVITLVLILASCYVVSLLAGIMYNQLLAIITQGVLKKTRCLMFSKMQTFPIKYFDTL